MCPTEMSSGQANRILYRHSHCSSYLEKDDWEEESDVDDMEDAIKGRQVNKKKKKRNINDKKVEMFMMEI